MVDTKITTGVFCRPYSVGRPLVLQSACSRGLGQEQDIRIGAPQVGGVCLHRLPGNMASLVSHFLNQEIFFPLTFPWDALYQLDLPKKAEGYRLSPCL